MNLKTYNEKRDFSKTAEPTAGSSTDKDHLVFVVQKHQASHLHYDFRLEMNGVLKSWAIPKGPSTDPKVKHLAMMVEDHPFNYRNFEGTIPPGEYGGGTVIVWDYGTYEPIVAINGKFAQEKYLLNQLESGSLKIRLHGKKLKGEFALVKTNGMADNSWLLIKHNDQFASKIDITMLESSVISHLSIEEMAGKSTAQKSNIHKTTNTSASSADNLYMDLKEMGVIDKVDESETVSENFNERDILTLLKRAPFSDMPSMIKPMKPTLVNRAFDDQEWLFEVKWDGYRAIAELTGDHVELFSRNDKSFDRFYPILQIMQRWNIKAVFDGEVVVLDDLGVSDFGALQNWHTENDGNLVYNVFDILWYDGRNLMSLPLVQRQAILTEVLPKAQNRIRQSQAFRKIGKLFFEAAERLGLEGIVAKKADSVYTDNLRTNEWLKIKVQRRQEVVIVGYTKKTDTIKPFSSLILGVYDGGNLRYVGKVGTGFSISLQNQLMREFASHVTPENPLSNLSSEVVHKYFADQSLVWLKPELVCEVNFAEVTEEGLLRQASFKGMRIDKDAGEVVLEKLNDTDETMKEVTNGN